MVRVGCREVQLLNPSLSIFVWARRQYSRDELIVCMADELNLDIQLVKVRVKGQIWED